MGEFEREKNRLAGAAGNSVGKTAVELAANEGFIEGVWDIRDRAFAGSLAHEDLPGEFKTLESQFKIPLDMRSHVYELVPFLLDAWDQDLAGKVIELRKAA